MPPPPPSPDAAPAHPLAPPPAPAPAHRPRPYHFLLLMVAAAALYLAGNGRVTLWDRDEAWYAQTSRQMLASGDLVVPRFLDKIRTAKPVFIYWCQVASMKALGVNAFAARLPSALAMTVSLILLSLVLIRFAGTAQAFWTVFIFATSGMVIASAKMCLTDSVQLVFILVAQLCLFWIYFNFWASPPTGEGKSPYRSHWPVALTMWIAMGLAFLTKGPVVLGMLIPLMLVLALLDAGWPWNWAAWKRALSWWPRTQPLAGIFIIAAIFGPWLVAMQQRDPAYLRTTFFHDIVDRMSTGLESHKGPPGYYLLTIWGTYFPWCIFLPLALVTAWKHRIQPPIRYALAAIIGPWIFMEFVQTKLPHYILPVYASLAFLTAYALLRCLRGQCLDLARTGFHIALVVWALFVVVLACVPWVAHHYFAAESSTSAATAFTVVGVCYALIVPMLFFRGRTVAGILAMGGGMMAAIAVLYGIYLPRAEFIRLSPRVAAVLAQQRVDQSRIGSVKMLGYKEPSLPFYQGGTIREKDNGWLERTPLADWPEAMVITSDIYEKLPPELRSHLRQRGPTLRGFNYAGGGKIVQVMVMGKSSE
ncbi:MAG TPA: glycosyltransferase family 39 protein [Tepidisphaeraceae bacterium]